LRLAMTAQDTFTPDEYGQWIIEVHFQSSYVRQTVNVSYFVLPESPIGTIALMVASLGAVGAFVAFKKTMHQKRYDQSTSL
jgi:hypothetical protein